MLWQQLNKKEKKKVENNELQHDRKKLLAKSQQSIVKRTHTYTLTRTYVGT